MEKTFHFVHGTQVDSANRRLMRSHVMKGKNAGKTFHRPSRLDLARPRPYHYTTLLRTSRATNEEETSADSRGLCPITIARNLGNVFLTFSFPLELTPDSLKVIDQFFIYVVQKMYPSHLGLSSDEAKSLWLRFMFTDEAACHCSIALMETCNEFFFSDGVSSPKALYHLSQTFTLVNKRLQSDEALSDSTLGIVLLLIFQEQLRNAKLDSRIHYEGLRKMVELRGGLCQLEGNLPLLLKICKTDITYALQQGEPILFFRDRMSEVRNTLAARGFSLDRDSAASAIRHTGLDPYLHEVLLDVISLTSLFNNLPADRILHINTFQEMLVSILSRLIRFCPLQSPKQESNIEAAYHIGLTVFMMTLFLQYDRRRIMEYELVSLCLKDVLDSGLDEHDGDLAIWLMFIGGIWTSGDTNGGWLVSRIRRSVRRLGINSWADVHSSVSKFPWISALHDRSGRAVWNMVYQGCQIP